MADGSFRTIDRDHELWWAIQGAGHNFGIVTSITSKIYDVERPNWAYQSFIFTGDKVEGLYNNINEQLLKNGTQSVDIINYSFFFNNPAIDPENVSLDVPFEGLLENTNCIQPVIAFYILQEGVDKVDDIHTAPFTALGPSTVGGEAGDYRDIPRWTGNGNDGPVCQKLGFANIRFPIDLQIYDVVAQRQVYDLFASSMKETPALNNSLFLFEGYSLQGVKAIPHENTAYPFRQSNLLVAPLIIYKEEDSELDRKAENLGVMLRNILHEASGQTELHTYVNYAFGNERVWNWYGYEKWRQDRLFALKNKYDPDRKFSFYAPIA